jgi:RNA-binding protein 5/10
MLSFSGPTHVLVVRGLDENADEEMLRYEFAKHAPIKVIIKLNT